MARASYVQPSFLGGEWSQTAQGNVADPKYKIGMNVCLNGIQMQTGAWTRRPGFAHGGFTRGGTAGRVIDFDFEDTAPYVTEFTTGFARFWSSGSSGLELSTTNDSIAITAISTATPAVVHLSAAMPASWTTGNSFYFSGLGTNNPLLQNRVFIGTVIDSTHVSIADGITNTAINGSLLGAFSAGTLNRVQEVATPYTSALLSSLRMVQTEEAAYLLQPSVAPQFLNVAPPVGTNFATFSLEAVEFEDGPYFDPPTSGVMVTPNQLTGVVQLSLSFPLYVATTSYAKGDFVTSSSVNYESLVDLNINNIPVSSPSDWAPVQASSAINNGQGWLPSDIGRLIRLFSEPALWFSGSTYAAGAVISYNPTQQPGASTYWQSLTSSNTDKVPGTDTTNWEPVAPGATLPSLPDGTTSPLAASGPAQWTWGKITSLVNFISGTISGVAQIGTMTSDGGLSAAFNGNTSQNQASSAVAGMGKPGTTVFVGQNYTGCSPAAFAIASATVFPSSDQGLANLLSAIGQNGSTVSITASLYGANTTPGSNPTAGTLLGSTFVGTASANGNFGTAILGTSPVTIASSDLTDTWAYVWVAFAVTITGNANSVSVNVAQVEFVNAAGTGSSSNGINVELLGPQLLYTAPIITWRLGLYSGTTGYPTCGCWSDGRLWLSGVIPNRFDASFSNGNQALNGINTPLINFAPTDQYGNVTDACGISETFNAKGTNQIYWMEEDQQGIICGTPGGEFLIFAPTAGGLSPLNIDSRRVTKIRCANILPARTEHTNVFVQAFQRKLMEYFPDVFSGKFTAPDLTEDFKHLTVSGIAEIAYQQELVPIIWMRLNNGNLIGATYKRDTLMTSTGPTFIAGHRHTLGSGNQVTSICAGPSESGNLDALTAVTLDSSGLYHVETLTDLFEEGDIVQNAWFCDEAVTPSSFTVSGTAVTLNGLWHLNGQTCTAFINGLDCGDFVVANGSMAVPLFGQSGQTNTLFTAAFAALLTTSSPIVVGFSYESDGQGLRHYDPPEAGTRLGPAVGTLSRAHKFACKVVNTQGISFGSNFGPLAKFHPYIFTKADGKTLLPSNQLVTRVIRDNVDDDYALENAIAWKITRPWPATVANMSGKVESADI